MRNKGFNQIPAGFLKGFGTAEVCCVGLHEGWIQVVLSNQQAKLVAKPWLAIVTIAAGVKGHHLICLVGFGGLWSPAELLDRAESDSVSLTKGAVDGMGFGDSHLGAEDERRCVRRIRISIAYEPFRIGRFEDSSSEHPMIGRDVAEMEDLLDLDTGTMSALG